MRKRLLPTALLMTLMFVSTSWARSGKEYKVPGGPSGQNPYGALVSDAAGNLFGTTPYGGSRVGNVCSNSGCGTVFMLSPTPRGGWIGKVIYTFLGGNDGGFPGGNLTIDTQGNLYGTANIGLGIIFKISQNQDGSWTETVIYRFLSLSVAADPSSGIVFDSQGNLYGTTYEGCVCNGYCGGTLYVLTPNQGSWTFSLIYNFPLGEGGNTGPGALSIDAGGNLYGVTYAGGAYGRGTVFEVSPNPDGTWTTNTLYEFQDGLDGGAPNGAPVFDSAGYLYGEASEGGSLACPVTGCGLIFRLVPNPDGTWTYGVVYTFNGLNGKKGLQPWGGLTIDAAGALYGATTQGGDLTCFGFTQGCGTIFELIPTNGGSSFTHKTLAVFDGPDGGDPQGGVLIDAEGNIEGTAPLGGNLNCDPPYGCGVIFKIRP